MPSQEQIIHSPFPSKLVWSSTGPQGQEIAIIAATPTLVEIPNAPFAEYNSECVSFDIVNDWIDVSAVPADAWITIRASYIGTTGTAEITPSFNLIPDRNDLNTSFIIHGQSSIQKSAASSSYITEGFLGDTDVIQVFIETDKNETISVQGLSIQIHLP